MLVVGIDHVRVHVVHEAAVSGYGPDEVLIVLCTKDDRLQLRLHSLYDTHLRISGLNSASRSVLAGG